MKRRQIPEILAHVAHDDGLAGLQSRTAQSLTNRKTWIRCRFLAALGHNHERVLDNLVNANPARIAGGANHLHELLHSFARAPAGQRKSPDLLQLFARGFLHSRENTLAHKKPSASTISSFSSRVCLLDDDVGKTGIGADRWCIEQFATVDGVRILAKDFAMCCSRGRCPRPAAVNARGSSNSEQNRNVLITV